MIIGVSELQKNISIFKNLTESVQIVDKKTKEVLALVLPKSQMQTANLTDTLGGILQKSKALKKHDELDDMIEEAYDMEMREKYGK